MGKAAALAVIGSLVLATGAAAYFTASYILAATGTSTQTVASSGGTPGNLGNALTLSSSWGPTFSGGQALAPGVTDPIGIFVTNNDPSHTYKLSNLTAAVSVDTTHQTAGCQSSWFTVSLSAADGNGGAVDALNTSTAYDAAAGSTAVHVGDSNGTIAMTSLPTVDQSSCEGAQLSVTLTAGSVTTP
jgi:hypothetical protein